MLLLCMATKNQTIKKLSYILALIVIIGAIIFVFNFNNQENKAIDEIITIGATMPITGFLSEYGEAYKNGLLMAVDEINNNGGINGKKLELDITDNQADATKAVNDVTYFTQIKNYPVVYNSMEYLTLASKDITENQNTIMITYTTLKFNENTTQDYLFRDFWDMELIGNDFAKVMNENTNTKFAYLSLNDPSLSNFRKGINNGFKDEPLEDELYNYGESDFKTQLLKIKEDKEVNTIVIYGFPSEVDIILKQMEELDMYDYKLFATEIATGFITQNHKELLQKTNAITYDGTNFNENSNFVLEYERLYGNKPKPDAYYIYDNLIKVSDAMKICDEVTFADDTECIKNHIQKDYDENNNKFRLLPIIEYNNGWVLVE